MTGMDRPEGTESWRLPPSARPPLLGELVERIDEALATARSSEAAVMTVGAAALDAADQAKRAADLAERASVAARAATRPPAGNAGANGAAPGPAKGAIPSPPAGHATDDFSARADRLAERLSRLQRLPLSA
jgi:hypothetical protein